MCYCYKILRSSVKMVLLFSLAGCSFFNKDETPLKGERETALITLSKLQSDLQGEDIDISLEPSQDVIAWPQEGYNASHVIPHAGGQGTFEVQWETSVGTGNTSDHFVVVPPVASGETVYTLDGTSTVTAVHYKTGRILWEKSLDIQNEDIRPGGGIAYIDESLIVVLSSGDLYRLKAEDGSIMWHQPIRASFRSGPTVFEDTFYSITHNNMVMSFSVSTGSMLWKTNSIEEVLTIAGGAKPVATGTTVFAPYTSGSIRAHHPYNGFPLWFDTIESFDVSSSTSFIHQIRALPVYEDGQLYVSSQSGAFVALNGYTGQQEWKKELTLQNTPAISSHFLFLITHNNELVCMTKGLGQIVFVKQLPEYQDSNNKSERIQWFGPILFNNALIVVSSHGRLMALSPQNGSIQKTLDLPKATYLPPIVLKGTVFILTYNANLVAVR